MNRPDSTPSRREFLKSVTAGAAVAMLAPELRADERTEFKHDFIRRENAQPGTKDWLLTNTRIDPATKYRCPWIEGFCSHTSIRAGETLAVMVSTNPPSPFVIDLYRLGYYGGKGGRHLATLGPFRGKPQPDPDVGEERLRECRWEPATTLVIPKDWPSGVYLG